jgi:hypothetical protein
MRENAGEAKEKAMERASKKGQKWRDANIVF